MEPIIFVQMLSMPSFHCVPQKLTWSARLLYLSVFVSAF
jgi:hypothetical protein